MTVEAKWNGMSQRERASFSIAAGLTPETGYHIKTMEWKEIPEWIRKLLAKA